MTLHSSVGPFVVLDASVWVSRLVPQDEFHEDIKSWMEHQRGAGVQFVSSALLLAEVGGAVSRLTGNPSFGRQAITQLKRLPGCCWLRWTVNNPMPKGRGFDPDAAR
jgi:predicted nucleic acid-binding protein